MSTKQSAFVLKRKTENYAPLNSKADTSTNRDRWLKRSGNFGFVGM